MENDIPMLNSIRRTTQMGCYGIKSVMNETVNRDFRNDLRAQLNEYEQIYTEADQLLREHGGRARNLSPIARYGAALSAKMRVRTSLDPTAKIAEMMLQGSAKGMIKSMQNIRTMGVLDPKVSTLSKRLLQTEQANFNQMKQYL